jgi:hypothetical protein
MKSIKALVAVACVVIAFGAVGESAQARNLLFNVTRHRFTFSRVEFRGGLGTTRCDITLEGSFHSTTIPKILESLVGYTIDSEAGNCETGDMIILTTVTQHRRYTGFTGSLPIISGVSTKIIGFAFRIREPVFGIECLATSTAESPVTLRYNREAGGRVTSGDLGGSIRCGGSITGTLRGTSNSSSPPLGITLI